ncbi:MAG: hypothetical protein ABMA13_16365 [Chthoniobacteraceae bacterium]
MKYPVRLLLILALVALPGCTTLKRLWPFKNRTPRAERVHPAPERVGVIVLVNEDSRFVLIDTTTGVIPASGTALKALRHEAEIAVLHAGEVQRRPFVVADIISGDPSRGDLVFR